MRRRSVAVVAVIGVASAWLGCNGLLGIESAVFDPEAAAADDGGFPDGVAPDGLAPGDGAADLDGGEAGTCTGVDLQVDPRHCGRCNHDCQGGLCAAGACRPATVATDLGGAFSIAIDETHVYWTNRITQTIKRAPKRGGTVEVVFSKPGTELAEGLAVRDGKVIFGTRDLDGGVLQCPVAGCGVNAPATVAPLAPARLDVADGGLLAFATAATGDIYRCTLPCAGGAELVAAGQGLMIGVASAPGQVLWSRIPLELRTRFDGNAPTTLDTGNFVNEMVVVGDELVYGQLGSGARVSLRDGGAKRTLLAGPPRNTDHVAVRDGTVFFNDYSSSANNGTILACPLAGCGDAGGVLATDQAAPHGIAVDELTVFWANSGADDAGAVMRLAR